MFAGCTWCQLIEAFFRYELSLLVTSLNVNTHLERGRGVRRERADGRVRPRGRLRRDAAALPLPVEEVRHRLHRRRRHLRPGAAQRVRHGSRRPNIEGRRWVQFRGELQVFLPGKM